MRLILKNPHCSGHGKTVAHTILRKKLIFKYVYLIDYLKDKRKKTAIFVDGTKTSFSVIGIKLIFFKKFFSFIELLLWMAINRINPFQNRIYFNSKKLTKHDILVDSCRSLNDKIKDFKGIHLIFFTHYFLNAEQTAEKLKKIPNLLAVAENDLTTNSFFLKYFSFINQVYHLPFVFGQRFESLRNFSERTNKCLAIGTIAPVDDENLVFREFFKCDILQPMRKIIAENAEKYKSEFDSKITLFKNFSTIDKAIFKKQWHTRFLLKHLPFLLKIAYADQHKNYFKFDIVEEFNSHKMFVCPEELIGLPSVNVFEGMATGCVFFGIDDPMYTNLGLIPGVHYIAYEKDNFGDLVQKIRYYQKNPHLLEKISKNGCSYIRNNFNSYAVAEIFWKDLQKISDSFFATGNLKIDCSFVK